MARTFHHGINGLAFNHLRRGISGGAIGRRLQYRDSTNGLRSEGWNTQTKKKHLSFFFFIHEDSLICEVTYTSRFL